MHTLKKQPITGTVEVLHPTMDSSLVLSIITCDNEFTSENSTGTSHFILTKSLEQNRGGIW